MAFDREIINYQIHTDAIKEKLIPITVTKKRPSPSSMNTFSKSNYQVLIPWELMVHQPLSN